MLREADINPRVNENEDDGRFQYPKVLIIGSTFQTKSGGGITLKNLFSDWPVDKIGVITDRIAETDPGLKYSFYQLGWEEIRYPFPFYFMQSRIKSGPINFAHKVGGSSLKHHNSAISKIKGSMRNNFNKILELIGITPLFNSIKVSDTLKRWILEFNPDLIYIRPFYTEVMTFGNSLFEELHIPYVIHIMDDSVRYNNRSLFKRHKRQNYIESQFKQLIVNASECLCISEAMATEYQLRYGRRFDHFRNPVDLDKWLPFQKKDLNCSNNVLKIIYTGRLFPPTFFTLLDMCLAVDSLNRKGKRVEIDIYSYDKNKRFNSRTKRLLGVNLKNPVSVDEVPLLVSNYDIFYLCLDFDKKAQEYSRLSLSTRTSEGMISGVPVLIYVPDSSAMSHYFKMHNAGIVVTNQDRSRLEEKIMLLCTDIDLREEVSRNAIKTAISDSRSDFVKESFRNSLIKAAR